MLRKSYSATKIISMFVLSVFLIGISACTESGGGGGPSAPNLTALDAVINSADAMANEVMVADSADTVPVGKYWVKQDVKDTLRKAIAQAIIARKAGTQAAIDAAKQALDGAVTAFEAERKEGTKVESPPTADKSALNTAIATANNAKSGIVVGTSADAVPLGVSFVTQSDMDALETAVAAADGIVQKTDATQAEVDEQTTALNNAVTTFNNAKGIGTNTEMENADKNALNIAITAAGSAKSGVVIDTSAENVLIGTYWTTQDAMDALDNAITLAQAVAQKADATQTDVDAQTTALNNAVTAFNTAKQQGTKSPKALLNSAITTATNAKSGVVVATSAENVNVGVDWTTQAAMTALETAIAAAQAVAQKTDATQDEIDTQTTALNTAVYTFNAAKQQGTKSPKALLNNAITESTNAKSGVVIATSAENVNVGTYWTTQDAMTALETAITAAQAVAQKADATQAEIDAQTTALNAAVTTFNNAKQQGTKQGQPPDPSAPTFLVFNQGTPAAETTTTVPTLATTANGADRLVFKNTNPSAQFPNAVNDVANNTVVYLDTPATGTFTFSARVKITRLYVTSGSGASGIIFGALADPAKANTEAPLYPVRFIGVRMGTDGAKRLYRSATDAHGATGNTIPGYWDEEFILKVERKSNQYELGIYDSKDPSTSKGTWTASSGMIADVGLNSPVHLGFIIGAVDVEVSNISVTAGGEAIFSTPATTASPWGAKEVAITTTNAVGAGDGYDYQSTVDAFPSDGVQLTATVAPTNADSTAVTWSITEGGTYAGVSAGGLVTIISSAITDTAAITVKAVSEGNASIYDEFKFNITKTAPKATGVTISGPTTVMVNKTITFAAEVAPAQLSQEVTWSVVNGTGTASISNGVLSATSAGTVTVYAKSVAAGASGQGVDSAGYTVTITPYERIVWWNFQTLPTGWSENTDYNSADTTYRDVNNEMDMVFLKSRSQKIETTAKAPTGSGFSDGRHTSGGKGDFATISQVQGPFSITLNYASNNSNARRPAIKINGTLYDGGETSTGEAKTYTYTYTGTDKVTVTLTNGNSAHPGSIYDIIIKDPSADLPIVIGFTDQGAGAFTQDDFTISKSGGNNNQKIKVITLAASSSWDSIQWYIDGRPKGTTSAISIDAAKYTLGGHTLEVEVVKNGVPWSKGTKFTVTQ
jgi:hypothetical protein